MHESSKCLIQQVTGLDCDRGQSTTQMYLLLSLATVAAARRVGTCCRIEHRDRSESAFIEHLEAITKLRVQVRVKVTLSRNDTERSFVRFVVARRVELQWMPISKWAVPRLVDCHLKQPKRSIQPPLVELNLRRIEEHLHRLESVIEISNTAHQVRSLDQ